MYVIAAAGVAFSLLPPISVSWFADVSAPGFFMTTLCVFFIPIVFVFFKDLTRDPEFTKRTRFR
jgi:hypothetical protein